MAGPSFLQAAELRRSGVVNLLGDLIRIPSMSAYEGEVVARLREEMEVLGYDEVWVDEFGSIIGRIGNGPVRIVYDSHIDTVDIGARSEWSRDPFEPYTAGNIMYGRGASDDKAGMAAMVYGGALYQHMGLTDDVTLYVVGSVQEEDCDGLALEHVLTETLPRPDLVVLGEATDCQVFRGNRGRVEALVRMRGSSCHGSMPHVGMNPTYDLGRVLTDIESLNDRLGWDDFLGSGTIAVTKIECETPSLNAVPSTATLYVDRRLTAGEDPDRAMAELMDLPSVKAVNGEVELLHYERTSFTGMTLGMPKQYSTWVTPEDHVSVSTAVSVGEAALGRTPDIGHWVFSTNGVASMGKLGIPTIGFGPADEVHAHTVHDQCELDGLVDSMAWYAAFPRSYAEQIRTAEQTEDLAPVEERRTTWESADRGPTSEDLAT
ncbi:MAG: YgeY family selenium metabolism-linked hydrolase [Actinomycetota bacterium]